MKTVLICPLDWGIGHATRCVPVIRKFTESGFKVIIAADGRPLDFLKREFPDIQTIHFPGTKITYQKDAFLFLRMLRIAPRFLHGISHEHRFLGNLLQKEHIDIIVSDNRYGLWTRKRHTILITHQCNIPIPFKNGLLTWFMNKLNHWLIRRFDECWIPDFELHQGLAGKLSHPPVPKTNSVYLGSLSRFSFDLPDPEQVQIPLLDILVSLSGPEPQRTIFEKKILQQLKTTNLRGIVIRGLTEDDKSYDLTENIRVYSHLETPQLKSVMLNTGVIICRSGYSSIMDIVTVGKRAIFIPTPGQPEQEYLARNMMDKKIFFSMSQRTFDLFYALEMAKNFPGMVMQNDYQVLEEEIRKLVVSRKL
ncbi:MAG: glycosyltransferase [Bacteroidetes bacterium]|nr:glycosyltransferase [Bacteroidota bacterium]